MRSPHSTDVPTVTLDMLAPPPPPESCGRGRARHARTAGCCPQSAVVVQRLSLLEAGIEAGARVVLVPEWTQARVEPVVMQSQHPR